MGKPPREISRLEDCGCTSYRLDDPNNPDSEEFWVMEVSCSAHVYCFKVRDEEMARHIRIDHGIKGEIDACDKCGLMFSTDDLFRATYFNEYWCTDCIEVDKQP